jgi:demethylmenaquinone methyltransferase/2-methoxy-6-polyprenyl-1,4-benzoquinol methylase
MTKTETTHFGFKEVPIDEKSAQVAEVFHTVAGRYDLMNDLMSFGLHRVWKQVMLTTSPVKPGHRMLDLASGTGDLALGFLKKVGEKGSVFLTDINESMLKYGRDKLINRGYCQNLFYVQADAESLPFPDNAFDGISIGFGLRNVTRKEKALEAMYRVIKPGGYLLVLEFSRPILPFIEKLYDAYSFSFLPKLGEWITGSAESYQYLVESIRQHPDQETLKNKILAAGFDHCDYLNLTGGIVCLHKAYKA